MTKSSCKISPSASFYKVKIERMTEGKPSNEAVSHKSKNAAGPHAPGLQASCSKIELGLKWNRPANNA